MYCLTNGADNTVTLYSTQVRLPHAAVPVLAKENSDEVVDVNFRLKLLNNVNTDA